MKLRCTIHAVTFTIEGVADGFPRECPVCLREEMNHMRAALDRVRDERNALLRAIEIKRDALLQPQP